MGKRQNLHRIYRPAIQMHIKEVNEVLAGRSAVRAGVAGLGDKLKSVQEKLNAERAKQEPNPVVIARCETVISRLKEIIGNAVKTHVIPQNVR